jgi:hypothetical protein
VSLIFLLEIDHRNISFFVLPSRLDCINGAEDTLNLYMNPLAKLQSAAVEACSTARPLQLYVTTSNIV